MGEIYCPNCDKYFDFNELKIHWDRNGRGDEHVCPDCGEFEGLQDVCKHSVPLDYNCNACSDEEAGIKHYNIQPIIDVLDLIIKRLQSDPIIYLNHKDGKGVV